MSSNELKLFNTVSPCKKCETACFPKDSWFGRKIRSWILSFWSKINRRFSFERFLSPPRRKYRESSFNPLRVKKRFLRKRKQKVIRTKNLFSPFWNKQIIFGGIKFESISYCKIIKNFEKNIFRNFFFRFFPKIFFDTFFSKSDWKNFSIWKISFLRTKFMDAPLFFDYHSLFFDFHPFLKK